MALARLFLRQPFFGVALVVETELCSKKMDAEGAPAQWVSTVEDGGERSFIGKIAGSKKPKIIKIRREFMDSCQTCSIENCGENSSGMQDRGRLQVL